MNRLLTILLLAAGTAYGQIANPPTSVNIVDATATGRAVLTATNAAAAATAVGLGTTNAVSFDSLTIGALSGDPLNVDFYQIESPSFNFFFDWEERRLAQGGNTIFSWNSTNASFAVPVSFATNVTVGGTLAVTGNTVLSGVNNTMPGATNAASASSLMTRNLFDERLPISFGLMDEPQADFGTVTLANGASGSKAAGGFEVTTGASNNATVFWNASSQAAFGRKNTTMGTSASTVWSTRVMVGWWFSRGLSTNSEIRFQYGRAYNATTHAALSARGVGVRIATNSVFFETHDGTTGFETTNVVTATNPMLYWAIVEAGVAKFYAGQTLVATVTNNVPANNSSGNDFGWVMSISNTSTNSSIMRVFANPGFVMQQ